MDKSQTQGAFDEEESVLPSTTGCEYRFSEDELSDEAVAYYLLREAEGTLTDEETDAFKSHISSCSSCRETYIRIKTVLNLLKGEGPLRGLPMPITGAASG